MLDSARFRTLLGRRFGVDPHHVHAYVIGEHGDSEVLTWSLAAIAGTRLEEFAVRHGDPVLTDAEKQQIDEQVRRAAYHIIAGKGATYYGIGIAVARLVNVLLHDQRAIITICSRIENVAGCEGVTVGLPHLVGAQGALALFRLPSFWGGYRVTPETIEFWQGGHDRLHDRFEYTRQSDDSWRIERLAP
jgi:L-lactate dehydrogenase